MKTIDNYILERLNPRHLGSTDKFPINGTMDEIVEFLKRQGYEKLHNRYYASEWHQFVSIFNHLHIQGWMYYLAGDFTTLTFADTTDKEISKENQMIQIHFRNDKPIEWIAVSDRFAEKYCTEKEFLDILNEQFGW